MSSQALAEAVDVSAPPSSELSASESIESDNKQDLNLRPTGNSGEDKYSHIVRIVPHERLDRYAPGGYHPVVLGDTFCDGRYTIRHKLGHGGFSTVWLARDNREEIWVSIKIRQARVSTAQLDDDPELKVLGQLEQHYLDTHSKKARCYAEPRDSFQHTGPNGTHNCLVSELLGPTLGAVLHCLNHIDIRETLRPDTILRASNQLLEAVEFIHQAGIAHGDISPSNVAFTCTDAFNSDEDLWHMMGGEPVVVEYDGKEPRSPHFPQQLVRSTEWPSWFDTPYDDLCLIDFGESFPVDETRTELNQPFHLRCPETFFLDSMDCRHDVWRTGCVIATLFHQSSPIPWAGTDSEFILALVEARGPLPLSWRPKLQEFLGGESDEDYFEWKGERLVDAFDARRETIIANTKKSERYEKSEYTADDYQGLRCLLHIMRGLMEHEPDKRLSIQEAIRSISWVDHWREVERSEQEDSQEG